MNEKELAKQLIQAIGGVENVRRAWHCITRIRLNVVDEEKVNVEEVKSLNGVLGAQFQSGQFQVIIGGGVSGVFNELEKDLGDDIQQPNAPRKKMNIIEYILDVISGIFTPILPAIIGAGLLKGLVALLLAFNLLSETGSNYQILDFISDAPFHFLPFLIAFSAATKFDVDRSLSVTLAGVLMYPQIMEFAATGEVSSLPFLGIPIPMNGYESTVIPIILGVWLLSYVYKYVDKIIPNSLRIVFVPLVSLLITAPLMLMFIAPLGSYVGIYLEEFFTGLFSIAGPIAGLLMGGLMPLIVITGMHYAFFPGTFASLDRYGYDIMLLPINLVSNIAQAGATLAVFFRTKSKKMKQISFSAFIPAIFGITEPAIYGVTLRLKKPFYASLIGGAVGGAIYGTMSVKTLAFSIPGVMALPTYIESGTNNLLYAVIGMVSSFITALVVTLILGFEEFEEDEELEDQSAQAMTAGQDDQITETKMPIKLSSPLTGKLIPLEDVQDKVFSQEQVGKGIGIIPEDEVVYSPFSGEVTMIAKTYHAIGITSNDGVEMLIHIGLETVNLNRKGFELLVEEGAKIEKGDKLMTFDLQSLKQEEEVSIVSPITITNTPEFLDVVPVTEEEQVTACDEDILIIVQ